MVVTLLCQPLYFQAISTIKFSFTISILEFLQWTSLILMFCLQIYFQICSADFWRPCHAVGFPHFLAVLAHIGQIRFIFSPCWLLFSLGVLHGNLWQNMVDRDFSFGLAQSIKQKSEAAVHPARIFLPPHTLLSCPTVCRRQAARTTPQL